MTMRQAMRQACNAHAPSNAPSNAQDGAKQCTIRTNVTNVRSSGLSRRRILQLSYAREHRPIHRDIHTWGQTP